MHPDHEPTTITVGGDLDDTVYHANITHNLGKMAAEAGVYMALWRPEEIGVTTASQVVEPLQSGLALLVAEPARFMAFSPANGWGSYDGLVRSVREYLAACREYPNAAVSVSR